MVEAPLVSVVMPVYQSDEYLGEAVLSILNQTYANIEFIIIVDKPLPLTKQILDKYSALDKRISVYYFEDRRGIVESLNFGCQLAKGKYVARMDSDDISLPNRIEKQITYLEAHSDVGLLGTSSEIIGNNDKVIYKVYTDPKILKWSLIYTNCLTHPSIIIRKETLQKVGYYRNEALYAEDYDLWARSSRITKIANLPDVLFKYRIHDNSVSLIHSDEQEKVVLDIIYTNIKNMLGSDISHDDLINIRKITKGYRPYSVNRIGYSINVILSLYEKYITTNHLTWKEFTWVTNDVLKMLIRLVIYENKLPLWYRMSLLLKIISIKFKSIKIIM